jgi:hypothetical protein
VNSAKPLSRDIPLPNHFVGQRREARRVDGRARELRCRRYLWRGLPGQIPDDAFFDELFGQPLIIARLNVLVRRGRYEEYLRLSAGEDTRHAFMLARLDRSDEVVEYASKHLSRL